MTAALAAAPAIESGTSTLPRTVHAVPQQFPGQHPSAPDSVQSAPPSHAARAPVPRTHHRLRNQDMPSAGPERSALPYLDSVPVSEPPFDDELPAVDSSNGALLSRTGEAESAPGAAHHRRADSAEVAPSAVAVQARWNPTSASAMTGPAPARLGSAAAQLNGTPPAARTLTGPPPTGSESAGAATTVIAPIRTRHRAQLSPTGLVNPPSTTGRRIAIGASGVPSWSSESDVGVRRTGTQALPPARRTGQMFARALVEILSGRRPLAQLRVHCAPDIYAGLVDRPTPAAVCLPHLLTVRVCEPADGVAEVSAAFRRAQRVRAIAFRMQGVDGRWRITALEVG